MATIDLRVGDGDAAPFTNNTPFVVSATWDAAENPAAATDIVQLIDVPAGTFIEGLRVKVETAEGAIATADIGDGTLATQFVTDLNLNALSDTVTAATVRKLYTTAGVIQLAPDAACDLVKVTVTAFGVSL